ncbi:alpha/beta hydrolase [Rubinisphaera italica]|uniref:Carboxylesterase NlhH n=1 Tax=Rubinisphaera italica TaxID=2527969 RepID=A0A5C5XE77_9PLAN|nr:alpha/beta hydrolase [Rubinisphaera italica]TWT61416.1 Carboxylesterase NlhH [Rubinisphaera italica]
MKRFCRLMIGIVLVAASMEHASSIMAQPPFAPAQKNVAYDDQDKSQVLDVYQTKSEKPAPVMVYIHGGGWRGGSKNQIPGWLRQGFEKGLFSVVAVEYRFTNVDPHPAQVNDCVRAIQFIRHNAGKWNLDPQRIGVTGGSAGGHLTLWVALHDDAAEPKSEDPVEQESSRVNCAISFAGPTDWSLLSEIEHKHPAYRQLLGYEPRTSADEMKQDAKDDVSPISFVSDDDPPVMQVHGDHDDIVPIEHAKKMDQKLQEAGVKSELLIIPGGNHGVAGAGPQVTDRATAFVKEYLLSP